MKNAWIPILFGLVFVLSCKMKSKQDSAITLWVNSAQQDCMGVGPMHCLQVQYGEKLGDKAWTLF